MLSRWLYTTSRRISTPPVVQVLSLDARDTLIRTRERPDVVYSRFAIDYGLEIDTKNLFGFFLKNFDRMSRESPCFGYKHIGERNWWMEVVSSTLLDCSEKSSKELASAVAGKLYDYYATAEPWELVEDNAKVTLQKFRLKGINLVISSNFDSRLKPILSHFNLIDLFSMIILSGEVGYEKPDKKFFELIMNHFDLSESKEILHIGDNYKKDFLGAKSFGCRALLYDPFSKCSSVNSYDRISHVSALNLY